MTEKCSQECMKIPIIIENSYAQEEIEKLENFTKNEKNLFYILSILPKTKFYPNLYEIPVEIQEKSLLFDSKFECGNLRRVYQVKFLINVHNYKNFLKRSMRMNTI